MVRQAAGILVVSLACAALANVVSPRRIPWREDWSRRVEAKALKEGLPLVSIEQTRRFYDAKTHVFLDARPATDYRAGHIPGAHSIPYDNLDEGLVEAQQYLTAAQPIIAYCSGKSCDDSFLLALFLRNNGFTNVVLYADGFEQWKADGYPVEGGAP